MQLKNLFILFIHFHCCLAGSKGTWSFLIVHCQEWKMFFSYYFYLFIFSSSFHLLLLVLCASCFFLFGWAFGGSGERDLCKNTVWARRFFVLCSFCWFLINFTRSENELAKCPADTKVENKKYEKKQTKRTQVAEDPSVKICDFLTYFVACSFGFLSNCNEAPDGSRS